MSQFLAVKITVILALMSVILSSLEYYWLERGCLFKIYLPWEVLRTRTRWTSSGITGRFLSFTFERGGFEVIVVTRALSALFLIIVIYLSQDFGLGVGLLATLISLLSIAMIIRAPFGMEGSDQMSGIIVLSFGVGEILGGSETTRNVFLAFVALQSCLAYMTTGVAKFVSPIWRSGAAMIGIMSARSYGNEHIATYLNRAPWISVLLCWGIIVFQLYFTVGVALGSEWLVGALIIGAFFHFGVAGVMGLNCFLFAFLSPYAAIYYIREVFFISLL